MMMMMKFERVDDVRCFCVLCLCLEFYFFEEDSFFLSACEKKGKKVLHRALEKALFCSSVKLFFEEKVFKETRTNATLTTTLIKKKRRQRDDDVFLLLLKRGGGKERRKGVRR